MQITCQICFDPELEKCLQSMRRNLAQEGYCSSQQGETRPHLTLGNWSFNFKDHQEMIISELELIRQFPVTFDGVGQFPGQFGSAFLLPVISNQLHETYFKVQQIFNKYADSTDPYYTPDRWTPHCVMAFQVNSTNLLLAAEALLAAQFPLKGTASFIAIIERSSGQVLHKITCALNAEC